MSANLILTPELTSFSAPFDADNEFKLSEDECADFISVRDKLKGQTDMLREEVVKSVPYRFVPSSHTESTSTSTSTSRTNTRFNNVTDFAQWLKTRHYDCDKFVEWLTIPREKGRPLYTPNGSYLRIPDGSMTFTSILVRNIDPKTTAIELREIFAQYGFVRDVYIPINRITNTKSNYAFVEMTFNIESFSTLCDEFIRFNILHKASLKIQEATAGRRTSKEMKMRYEA